MKTEFLDRFVPMLFDMTDIMRDIGSQAQTSSSDILATLTVRQHRVIKDVKKLSLEFPDGPLLKVLAESLKLSSATTSELVESLVQKGFLLRNTCPEDRRAVRIVLSDTSKGIFDVGRKAINGSCENVFDHISMDELESMFAILQNFKKNIIKK